MTAKYPKIKNKGISLKKRDNSGWLHAIQYKKVQISTRKKFKVYLNIANTQDP